MIDVGIFLGDLVIVRFRV